MSAQATWISDFAKGNQNASFEVEDATSAVAFDGGELSGGVFPTSSATALLSGVYSHMVRVVAPTTPRP